jgi:hypothetical protein
MTGLEMMRRSGLVRYGPAEREGTAREPYRTPACLRAPPSAEPEASA